MAETVPTKEEPRVLVPVRENSMFHSLQKEMNKLFEEFKGTLGLPHNNLVEPLVDYHARVDIKDQDKELIVTAELPGVDLNDLKVVVSSDAITIKGEKRTEKEEKDKGYYRMERTYGSFHRILPLPCPVEKDCAVAKYKDGVLTVTIPKAKGEVDSEKTLEVKPG